MQAQRSAPRVLFAAQDVTDHMLVLVVNCVEDRFPPDAGPMPVEDFIDRLCDDYLNGEGWDIEKLDSPAVRKIMRHARRTRQEMV